MIYDKDYMAKGEAKGKGARRLIVNQLAWLLVKRRQEVISAFRQAGYEVDDDATPLKLKELLRKAVVKIKESNSPKQVRKESRLLRNISALIIANRQAKNKRTKFIRGLFKPMTNLTGDYEKAREEYEASLTQSEDKEKSGWFKENQDAIIGAGTNIINTLFGNSGSDQVEDQVNTFENEGANSGRKSNTGLIIGVGLGAIAIIGLTVYFVKRKK